MWFHVQNEVSFPSALSRFINIIYWKPSGSQEFLYLFFFKGEWWSRSKKRNNNIKSHHLMHGLRLYESQPLQRHWPILHDFQHPCGCLLENIEMIWLDICGPAWNWVCWLMNKEPIDLEFDSLISLTFCILRTAILHKWCLFGLAPICITGTALNREFGLASTAWNHATESSGS